MVNEILSNSNELITSNLITKDDLITHFKDLGIHKGMVVYVQSSMEYFSYICGGNRVLFEALQDVIGYEGSIMTNSFTSDNLDPLVSGSKQFEPYQVEVVRDALPPFHKKLSQSKNALANQMMLHDGVYRSSHPTLSFVAWGKYAKLLCDKQPLHFSLGSDSPLAKLSELNGFVLLLGMKYEACDIFKHARRNDVLTPIKITCAPIEKAGHKTFMSTLDYEYKHKGIEEVVEMMEERQIVNETYIGRARCRLFSAKEAVTLAVAYDATHTR